MTSTLPALAPTGRRPRLDRAGPLLPALTAAALAVVAIALRWRGGDYPAHFFRVARVERDGFEVWNNQWFGGHHTLGYGALFPVLGAAIGIWTVAVLSAAAAALFADVLITRGLGHRCLAASLWFAAGTVTNVAIGRLPFALGLAVGLAALVAAQARRPVLTVVLVIATAAASPVVSAFLALVLAAWAWTSTGAVRARLAVVSMLSVVPVLLIAVVFPQGGTFPFHWPALTGTLLACLGVGLLVPVHHRLVRVAAAMYAAASVVVFLVPSPLGANLTRLGMYAAGPVLVALVPSRRAVVALAPLLWFWQWSPSFDAIFRAGDDPSLERAYYAPLLAHLGSVDAENRRTEIVPTARHWETAFVAARFPIARGWERQLDIRFNELFYSDDVLTAETYHAWLLDEGVDRVALADAPLDRAGEAEAALITAGLPYLRLAWSDQHWRVWEVVDATGVVDGAATVVDITADSVMLDVQAPGDVTLRVRSSAFWQTDPAVCVEPTEDGWLVLRDVPVGRLEVFLAESDLLTDGAARCDDS
jgi:hypothetical protein